MMNQTDQIIYEVIKQDVEHFLVHLFVVFNNGEIAF